MKYFRAVLKTIICSFSEPDQLGRLASNLSSSYQELAADAKSSSSSMAVNADSSQRIRHSVKELGTVTIELIKATGTCQMTPTDSFALRDVSETGRSVGEKVFFFLVIIAILGSIFVFL